MCIKIHEIAFGLRICSGVIFYRKLAKPVKPSNEDVVKTVLTDRFERRKLINLDFYGTDAMIWNTWTQVNNKKRHVATRMAVQFLQNEKEP